MPERPDYFEALKNALDFTYTDPDREEKLLGICSRAEGWLSNRLGEKIYFSARMEGKHLLQLLFDCVRYIENNVLDEFAANFGDSLDAARDWVQLNEMEAEDADEAQS